MSVDAPIVGAVVLRDYQADAVDRVLAASARVNSGVGVAATGLGKTVMFTEVIHRRGGRAVVLAHRDELVSQAVVKVCEAMPDLPITAASYAALVEADRPELADQRVVWAGPESIGIVKGTADDCDGRVVVASVQTLKGPRLARLASSGAFVTVVTDECHHAAADSYQAVYAALGAGLVGIGPCRRCGHHSAEHAALEEPVELGGPQRVLLSPSCSCAFPEFPDGPFHLGVTATPERGDGKGLDSTFAEVLFSYDTLFGIRSGYLADVQAKVIRLAGFDTSKLKVSGGDYTAGSAGRALTDANAPELVVKAWQQCAIDRKTLVFTPTVATAQAMSAEFSKHGIAAAWLSGDTPTAERRELLRSFKRGDTQVLVNCNVLTEGFDEPSVQCVVMARPTKVAGLYVQMVGRGLRRHPDKDYCLVLDVVGATDKHSLITLPTIFGMGDHPEAFGAGRLASDVVAEHDEQLLAAGLLAARDAELFKKMRKGKIAWVRTSDRRGWPMYTRTLGRDEPTVVLVRCKKEGDVWMTGLIYPDDTRRRILEQVPLEQAQAVGEDFIRKTNKRTGLVSTDAPWRAKKPSAKAVALAAKWRVRVLPDMTAGELSDAIDARITKAKQYSKAK